MNDTPVDVVQRLLANLTNRAIVESLVAEDAVYIYLSFENRELKTLLPWVGTTEGPRAAEAIVDTFSRAYLYWSVFDFTVTDIFGAKENVAAFGSLTCQSASLGKSTSSPFAVHAKVVDGQVVYLQFLEDTYATASTFRVRGSWYVHPDPEGKGFDFGT